MREEKQQQFNERPEIGELQEQLGLTLFAVGLPSYRIAMVAGDFKKEELYIECNYCLLELYRDCCIRESLMGLGCWVLPDRSWMRLELNLSLYYRAYF